MTIELEKKLEGKFFDLLKRTRVDSDWHEKWTEGGFHVRMARSYGSNGALLMWPHNIFHEVIDIAQEIDPKVGRKTIKREISQSIQNLLENALVSDDANPEVEAHIESLLQELDSDEVQSEVQRIVNVLKSKIVLHNALIPISGLRLKSPIKLGNITIYPLDRGDLPNLIDNWKHNEATHQRLLRNFSSEDFDSYMMITNIEGEFNYVHEKALELAQDYISVILFYIARPTHDKHYGIEVFSGAYRKQHILTYTDKAASPSWHMNAPQVQTYSIDSNRYEQWQKSYLDIIIALFDKEYTTVEDIESVDYAIKQSITWYARAVRAKTDDEKFVALMVSLENLLLPDRGQITQNLMNRTTYLLSRDSQQFQRISKKMKELYAERSSIVHSAVPVSRENLEWLENITKGVIIAFIGQGFRDWEDFRKWDKFIPKHIHLTFKIAELISELLPNDKTVSQPAKLYLKDDNILQPDIFWVNEANENCTLGDDDYWHGAPDLVVEVLSPSTAKRDKTDKFTIYESNAIPEYWIADPYNETLEVYVLEDAEFKRQGVYGEKDSFKSPVLGKEVGLSKIFPN